MAFSASGNQFLLAIPNGPDAGRQRRKRSRTVGVGIIFTKKSEIISKFHKCKF